MSKIFDNIETKFEEGIKAILMNVRCRVMDWEIGKPVLFMPPFEFKPIEDEK